MTGFGAGACWVGSPPTKGFDLEPHHVVQALAAFVDVVVTATTP
jgi:hypothetical protein